MKRHLDNPSSSGPRTKGSFDLLASVPARKGLGTLPEESKQGVPYAQGVLQAGVGRRLREEDWEKKKKRERKVSQLLS